MIRIAAIFLILAALISFLTGWISNPAGHLSSAPVSAARLNVPKVQTPGLGTVSASDYLLRLNPPPPPPPLPSKPTPPPPPPPPDVSIVFRKQLSAVVPAAGSKAPGEWQAELIDTRNGTRQVRTLHVGDEFQDGWTLMALTRQDALLKKKADQRHIIFFGPPAAVPIAPSKPQIVGRPVKPASSIPTTVQPGKVGPAPNPSAKP